MERRKFPRFKIEQMISIDYGKQEFLEAHGIDFSEEGVRCLTSVEVEMHSRVYLLLTLPEVISKDPFSCEGVVMYFEDIEDSEFCYVGIQLVDLTDEQKNMVKSYLEMLKEAS